MNIEATISAVENLYTQVTGQTLPAGSTKHSIQPNVDPISLLEVRMTELNHVLQHPSVWRQLQPWTPPMAAWESDEKIMLRLDLPAVGKEDLDISLRGNTLVVSGTRTAMPMMPGFMPRLSECCFGQFYRAIQLPIENVTPEISSTIKDGVLEISIVKQPLERSKKAGGKSMQ